MADNKAQSDDERLAEILSSMSQSVRAWVGELEAAAGRLARATSSEDRAQAVNALRNIAHDISGSAGTLGFTKIGDAASPVEMRCALFADAGRDPTDLERQEIVALVERVAAATSEFD